MKRLLPLVLILAACGGAEEATPPTVVSADTALLSADAVRIGGFTLAAAALEPWRETWRLPAQVETDPNALEPIGSIVEGRVLQVLVYPGDRVRAGDVLVAVHSHEVMDARKQLAAAIAAATTADSAATVAEAAAARAERLLAAKAVAVADVERARAARTAALATRNAADAERDRAVAFMEHLVGEGTPEGLDEHAALMRAPFDGVVTAREAQPGQVVLVGQSLVSVAREGALGLRIRVPEEAAAHVRVGESVRFRVPAYPERNFTARIARIAPTVDVTTRAIEVWARAEADAQRVLRAEMTADAELLGASESPALAVPAPAVQLFEGDTVVIKATRLGEGMMLEAVPVRIGRRTAEWAEVLSGLVAGDSVVAVGAALGKAEILKRKSGGEGE